MGCYTGYLLRDDDGSSWWAETKWGAWNLTDEAARTEVIDWVRADGSLLTSEGPVRFGASTCRGVALDLRDLVFRTFPCDLKGIHHEGLDMRIRKARHWDGWDAGFAWGGREELGDVVPGARHVIEPYDLSFRPLAELPLADRDEWALDEGHLISVVTADLQVLDYQLERRFTDADSLLPWLVHGSALVDALREEAPYETPWEDSVDAGVVIDLDQRVLRYWSDDVVPSRLLADVQEAWPGWPVRRLPYGLAGHLAATGRRDDEALASHADAEWDVARRALRPDPRPLRG
jgi:hypothetical protein